LEITNQVDDNTFIVTETLTGSYFDRYDVKQKTFTMDVYSDSVIFEGENYSGLKLFGHQTVSLKPNSRMEFSNNGWLISPNTTHKNLDGYLFDYKVGDTTFSGINAFVNYEPMTYDGGGLAFAYNYQLGIVRSYVINPWTAKADGFDLVNLMNEETQRNDFVDTKWELVSATTVDGKVKTAKELEADGYYILFTSEQEFFLYYGNESGGSYKLDGRKIDIEMGATTKILSPFIELYDILNQAQTYRATTNKLIIYSSHSEYSAVEFKLKSPDSDILGLTKNKWKLSQLVLSDRNIVFLEDYDGGVPLASNYILQFNRNGKYDGMSGCNTYTGNYKLVKNNVLTMNGWNLTEAACKFSYEYHEILNTAKTYDLFDGTLNIHTNHDEVKSLIFIPTR
jgi:heat shock protein HslJ